MSGGRSVGSRSTRPGIQGRCPSARRASGTESPSRPLGSSCGAGTDLSHAHLQYHVITTPELGRSPGGQWAGCQEKLVSRFLPEAGVSRCPYLGAELYLGFQQRRGEVSSQHGRCRVLRCCVCPHGRGQGRAGFNGQQASRLLSDHDGNYPGDILLSPNSSCNLLGGSQRQPA